MALKGEDAGAASTEPANSGRSGEVAFFLCDVILFTGFVTPRASPPYERRNATESDTHLSRHSVRS